VCGNLVQQSLSSSGPQPDPRHLFRIELKRLFALVCERPFRALKAHTADGQRRLSA
jgi:hypothetical protein